MKVIKLSRMSSVNFPSILIVTQHGVSRFFKSFVNTKRCANRDLQTRRYLLERGTHADALPNNSPANIS
jgi:hypothetical protein